MFLAAAIALGNNRFDGKLCCPRVNNSVCQVMHGLGLVTLVAAIILHNLKVGEGNVRDRIGADQWKALCPFLAVVQVVMLIGNCAAWPVYVKLAREGRPPPDEEEEICVVPPQRSREAVAASEPAAVVLEGEVVVTEEEGCHVEVEAPPGRLGLRFETGTGHLVISVAPTSALAGRVSVGDRLVSIRAPGREFYCGSLRTGSDIVAEFRATAGTKRVLTFARVATEEV